MKLKNKKGDLTTSQIILIISLLMGFTIVGYFVYHIFVQDTIDRETCHDSVVIRATLPSGTEGFMPLKCKTQKYCITSGLIGGNCEDTYGNEKGVRVTKVKVTNKEQIEKFIAQENIECWNMMGEGQLSLFSQGSAQYFGLGKIYPSCVVCSRIAFDFKNLEKIGITEDNLRDIDYVTYMSTHKMPGKDISYMDYFIGKGAAPADMTKQNINTLSDNIQEFTSEMQNQLGGNPSNRDLEEVAELKQLNDVIKKNIDGSASSDDKVELVSDSSNSKPEKQIGIIFMQISAPGHLDSLKNLGNAFLGIGGTAATFAPTTTLKLGINAVKLIAKNPIVAAVSAVVIIGTQQALVAWNRGIAQGYCGDIAFSSDARSGCSVVRTINYNQQGVSEFCSAIESIS